MRQTIRWACVAMFLGATAVSGQDEAAKQAPKAKYPAVKSALQIKVQNSKWGSSKRDIAKVLESAGSELWPLAYQTKLDPIRVFRGNSGPIVLFRRGPKGEYDVKLDTGNTYWAQFSYQFAHELCHILCEYKDGDKTNLWFEETLCETASLFALRRMAVTWKTRPPYPHWKSYSKHLYTYAQKRIDSHPLPEGATLSAWYADNAEPLSENGTDRKRNTTIAVRLLPLFEKDPKRWGAVAFVNKGRGKQAKDFATYLGDWRQHSPDRFKPFVDDVAKGFGVTIRK